MSKFEKELNFVRVGQTWTFVRFWDDSATPTSHTFGKSYEIGRITPNDVYLAKDDRDYEHPWSKKRFLHCFEREI